MTHTATVLVAALALFVATAEAEVRAVDGDTLAIDGQRVRLFGIDSPQRGQPGASEASDNLRQIIAQGSVRCVFVHRERGNRRNVSLCSVRGVDLSLAQVRSGNAVVWCSFARQYRPAMLAALKNAEAEAKRERSGIWARPFKPWRDWGC